ncbi:MAG: Type 1 glutamine amidotransferase-like domain-containing protein [Oscillospiraceae bacterium]|nr:Type 1 glutamine amidotransferase-like domain-containing protein [Oscillospiraceae bacterium]
MGRIVAISGGDLKSTKALNQYALDLCGKSNANVLFIGTASDDAPPYINNFKNAYSQFDCNVKVLSLVAEQYEASRIDDLLNWADVIYIGGGDTVRMMEVWKQYGLDEKLKTIYHNDSAVLTGISAGAICWFSCGHSDSESFYRDDWQYVWADGMLDIFHAAFCPHYNEEGRDSFDTMLKEKQLVGLAMENDTAFVVNGFEQYHIRCNPDAKGYMLRYAGDSLAKREVIFKYTL